MPLETSFRERFLKYIPQLMDNAAFAKEVRDSLGERAAEILALLQNHIALDEADEDELFEAAYEAYKKVAETILTLGWTGGSAGNSGAIWLNNCAAIYVITSSDYDDLGPFSSLEDALGEDCFHNPSPDPELTSATLPIDKLLAIARGVVDWDNQGGIVINSQWYEVSDNELVPTSEKD